MNHHVKTRAGSAQGGFTLVELAIVMIIIGLLTGGVLKGQQMIENARVTNTISQVNGFKAAYYSFRDTYAALPGDMANAQLRLAGCQTDAGNNCANGNGNGLIGNMLGAIGGVAAGEDVSNMPENIQFWKHLSLADLISGEVQPDSQTAAANVKWGVTNPSSPFGGGWHIGYMNDPADKTFGHMLRLARQPTGNIPNGQPGIHVLSPYRAAQIDRKLDDGRSNSGTVQAEYQGSGCDASGDYASTTVQKNCWMLFLID